MDADDIVRQVAEADPVGRSETGLSDECVFCGAYPRSFGPQYPSVYHVDTCAWVAARRHVGLDAAVAGDEPGPIHGPPTPRECQTMLERLLDDIGYRQKLAAMDTPLAFTVR